MITINHLLDLGILSDSNYEYKYADEYFDVMDYAHKHEADELNKRLIILRSTSAGEGKVTLDIKPDDYLIRRYQQSKEYEMQDAVNKVRKLCIDTYDCKNCPYYRELKPNGLMSDNCLLAGRIPPEW